MNKIKGETLQVDDLKHAVILAVKGVQLMEVKRLFGRKCAFLFENPEKAKKIISDFNFGKLRVDPRDIFRELSDFKTLIYSNYSLTEDENEDSIR